MRVARFVLSVVASLLVFVVVSPAAAQGPGVYITPSGGTYNVGDTIHITVDVCASPDNQWDGPQNLYAGPGQISSWEEHPGNRAYSCAGVMRAWDTTTIVIQSGGAWVSIGYGSSYWDQGVFQWSSYWEGSAMYYATSTTPIVTADGGEVVPQSSGVTSRFRVAATGSGTHTFSASCSGVASNCSGAGKVSPSSAYIANGSSLDVMVTYDVSGTPLATGQVTLTATFGTSAQASIPVRVAPTGPVIARDQCLTVAVGPNAAYECGDLRIVHPLPGVRTLGKVRTPTLLYNSQLARPRPIVTTNVTLASAADSVVATLNVGGLGAQSRSWPGSQFQSGAARRVGVAYDPGNGLRTGLHAYTLEVRRYDGSSPTTIATVSDTLAIVSRDSSAFGAGWWLAGFEQLHFPAAGGILWVGGDGSVRRYVSIGSNTYVAAPVDHPDTLLYRAGSNDYVRILPGGDSVVFASNGLHSRTVNRLGYRTEFVYDGSNRLYQIRVPPQLDSLVYTFSYGGNGRLSQVTAPDTAGGSGRVTTVGTTGLRITSIQDPGSSVAVGFGYGSGADSLRVAYRTNRRNATTYYAFDSGSRLRESKLGLSGAAADTIRTTFTAIAATRGLSTQDAAAEHPDSVFTRLDGPSDSADVSTFWIAPLGGASQIRDPYGYVTTVTQADPRWPALPTRTQTPSGRITSAAYDARGNLAAVVDSNLYVSGQNPTTQYQWDQRWDELTQIALPNGQITRFSLNAANGNVNYVEDARGSAARTNFTYVASGNGAGLVQTMTDAAGATTTLVYDWRGNVDSVRAPLGWPTVLVGDRLGRPRATKTPLGPQTTSNKWRTDSTVYDARDRVIRTASVGDTINGVPLQTLTARNYLDEEGNLYRVERTQAPNPTSLGTLTTQWTFDAANRPTVEVAPDGFSDSTWYDLAGNVTSTKTRRGHVITRTYDRMNRVLKRAAPAVTYPQRTSPGWLVQLTLSYDGYPNPNIHPYPWFPSAGGGLHIDSLTDTFAYDSGGRLITADNGDARVHRAYFKDGSLQTDSLYIRNYAGTTFGHVYGLRYTYDLNGRLSALHHPAQLATGTGMTDSVRYVYNDTTGALVQVTSLLGNQTSFLYNTRGELIRTTLPGGISDSLAYDSLGRLTLDRIRNQSNSPYKDADTLLRNTSLSYTDPVHVSYARNNHGWKDTVAATYSGLGYLIDLEYARPQNTVDSALYVMWRQAAGELSTSDPLGNVHYTDKATAGDIGWGSLGTPNPTSSGNSTGSSYFQSATGRADSTFNADGRHAFVYDSAGNTVFRYGTPSGNSANDWASFYGADGRLRVSEWREAWGNNGNWTDPAWQVVFEEYRYDALGRRVLVMNRQACWLWADSSAYANCQQSRIRRTVWDGARELWEMQMPARTEDSLLVENDTAAVTYWAGTQFDGLWADPNPLFGRVAYTYAGGVDRPVGVTRVKLARRKQSEGVTLWNPIELEPIWNWRGGAEVGTLADGGMKACTDATHCVAVQWRGVAFAVGLANELLWAPPDGQMPYGWFGTLMKDKEDGTGTHYRRNRYVDPMTGRFTQEDPLGLAGGLNLYGFASGDPVTFSDPFGLCPEWLDSVPCTQPVDSPMRPAVAKGVGTSGSECGWTRTDGSGEPEFHGAFDWAADEGAIVRAPADAAVSYHNDPEGAGFYVTMNLGNGAWLSVSHLDPSAYISTVPRRVAAGTVVGRVGTSGNSLGSGREPHAHIVTKVHGVRYDPRAFFAPIGQGGTCLR